jgi:secreted trypsin-like serine protease
MICARRLRLLALFGVPVLSDIQDRRLIIEGPYPDTTLSPYAVAIVACYSSQSSSLSTNYVQFCSSFCSGTLIAPDVVLTAGHCTHAQDSPFGTSQPVYPIANTFVVLGSTDLTKSEGKLVGVVSVSNAGFASSKAYPIDKDVGLVFLNQCVSEVSGSIKYAKVATLQSEPTGTCPEISSLGFGLAVNIPSSLQTQNARLRHTKDALHPHSVCLDSYVRILMQLRGYADGILDNPLYASAREFYYSQIVPELNLCSGGNSGVHAICRGDSGGGVFDSSGQVVGINSFGISGSSNENFCGWGSDYSSRVAFHASWVRDTITSESKNCPGWSIQDVFSTWPVTDMDPADYSKEYVASRCIDADQWQCMSGKCIPRSSVCNKVSDCGSGDNSDEEASFCSVAYSTVNARNDNVELKFMVDKFLQANPSEQFNPKSDLPYVIIGPSEAVSIIHSPVIEMPAPVSPPNRVSRASYSSVTPMADVPCRDIIAYINQVNTAARAEARNRPEYQPDIWTSMCARYFQCAVSDDDLNVFCDTWNEYVTKRELQIQIAQGFNTRFSATCPVPFMYPVESLPEFSITTTTTSPATAAGVPTSPPGNNGGVTEPSFGTQPTLDPSNVCSGSSCTTKSENRRLGNAVFHPCIAIIPFILLIS